MTDILASYLTLVDICKQPFKELTTFEYKEKPELFAQFVNNVQNQALMDKLENIQTAIKMILNKK